jgi:acyl-CoA thioester hydrolase
MSTDQARPRFAHGLRVRWSEADPQGVVFNPNYLLYADVAVTEFLRHLGVLSAEVPDVMQTYVVEAKVSFRAPARFDDELEIGVSVARIGRSSFELEADIDRQGQRLAEVRLIYARAIDGKAEPLSTAFRGLLEPHLLAAAV